MGFEFTISVFEQAKAVHALDGPATVFGKLSTNRNVFIAALVRLVSIYFAFVGWVCGWEEFGT
jgi:hypothetical protein